MSIESHSSSALTSSGEKELPFKPEFFSELLHALELSKNPAASREDMERTFDGLEERFRSSDVQENRLHGEDEAWKAYVALAERLNRPLNFDCNPDDGNIVPLKK